MTNRATIPPRSICSLSTSLQPQIWYLIPAQRVLHPKPKLHIRFYPEAPPRPGRRTPDHDYEPYREAWGLLGKDRRELAAGR